jgi:metallo-beta-lactamase class B
MPRDYRSCMRLQLTRVFPLLCVLALPLRGQVADTTPTGYTAAQCPSCAEWNAPQRPVHIYGNTYYVGTHGLASILVTSDAGHVLIDGGLPESAPIILANIRALGFRVEDVKLIVNSHAHYDHAGGIAALQRASGARVAASPWSAAVLRGGKATKEDPQYSIALAYPPVAGVAVFADGETLHAGGIAITAHFTPGHTPGGTSWTWRSCEGGRCFDLLYADSQTPVSSDDFFFTRSAVYPTAVKDFEHSLSALEQLPCDLLITPHPSVSSFWERISARDNGAVDALTDPSVRVKFIAAARQAVARRIARESEGAK